MTPYDIRKAIGAAVYGQGFVETGEYNAAFRSGAAVGAWVAQEVAKLEAPTLADIERIASELTARAFRDGTVRG